MNSMMNTIGWHYGFSWLWGVHVLAVIAFFTGLVFLIVWTVKNVHEKKLRQWGWTLVIAGTAVCLVTIGILGRPWAWYGANTFDMPMMRLSTVAGDNAPQGMMGGGMAMMLQGKTGDDFDRAFIAGMIPHHEGAIAMARMALESAKHDEIKQMARAIIDAQQREIDQMRQWMRDWGYTE